MLPAGRKVARIYELQQAGLLDGGDGLVGDLDAGNSTMMRRSPWVCTRGSTTPRALTRFSMMWPLRPAQPGSSSCPGSRSASSNTWTPLQVQSLLDLKVALELNRPKLMMQAWAVGHDDKWRWQPE